MFQHSQKTFPFIINTDIIPVCENLFNIQKKCDLYSATKLTLQAQLIVLAGIII